MISCPVLLRVFLTSLVLLAGMNGVLAEPAPPSQVQLQAINDWKAQRLGRLTSETGWLTLVGLYWLREGENTFGRASSNAIVLDHAALGSVLGTFVRKGQQVRFIAKSAGNVTVQGTPVTSLDLVSDAKGEPTTLEVGSLRFFVIERAGRIGIRVRDVNHPLRTGFQGLEYFPVDAGWIIDARFEPYTPSRRIPILNILGMTEQMESPGALIFNHEGREYRLDAVLEAPDDDELFIMFADATSGRETYGAGRFIYVPLPQQGRVALDFNRAYNPPCVFNEFATCPLPPQQNRLPMRIVAGEKKYLSH